MELPEAKELRIKTRQREELESNLAEKIISAFEKGHSQLILPLHFDDGDRNYHGQNQKAIVELLKSKGYKIEIRVEKEQNERFEGYLEVMTIDWS